MVYYFTPYSLEKKLFDAFDHYMTLLPKDDDWACFLDGDTAFLRPDWGRVIDEYVRRYPGTGLFTCYASRCHYLCQRVEDADMCNDSILYHKDIADRLATGRFEVVEVKRRVAGHLLLIKKSTWKRIRNAVAVMTRNKKVLGIDTKISSAVMASGFRILVMKDIYLFHYLRMKEGIDNKSHLL